MTKTLPQKKWLRSCGGKSKGKRRPKTKKILLPIAAKLAVRRSYCCFLASFLPSFLPSGFILHLLLQQQAAPPLLLLLFLSFQFWVTIMKTMMQMMTRGNKRTVMIWHDSSLSLSLARFSLIIKHPISPFLTPSLTSCSAAAAIKPMSERKHKRDDPQIPAAPAALPFGFAKLTSKKNSWRCSRKGLQKKQASNFKPGLLLSLFFLSFLFWQKQWLRGVGKGVMRFHCMRHAAAMPLPLLPLSSGSILLSFLLGSFLDFSLFFFFFFCQLLALFFYYCEFSPLA